MDKIAPRLDQYGNEIIAIEDQGQPCGICGRPTNKNYCTRGVGKTGEPTHGRCYDNARSASRMGQLHY